MPCIVDRGQYLSIRLVIYTLEAKYKRLKNQTYFSLYYAYCCCAECHHAKCRYGECRCGDCRGAINSARNGNADKGSKRRISKFCKLNLGKSKTKVGKKLKERRLEKVKERERDGEKERERERDSVRERKKEGVREKKGLRKERREEGRREKKG